MVLNLTQHDATPDQIEAGVVDLPAPAKARLRALLTFDTLPTGQDVFDRASDVAALAAAHTNPGTDVMIGGAPFFMAPLHRALLDDVGLRPVYAFSVRRSVDVQQEDGSVRKVATFSHAGFVAWD